MSLVCDCILYMPFLRHSYVLACHGMSLICTSISSLCHSYVICMSLVCTRMSSVYHSYVTRMSFVCTRKPSVCHSYVLVCHPYVTRMYPYVIPMSLVCGFTMNRFVGLKSRSKFVADPVATNKLFRVWNLKGFHHPVKKIP